MEFPNVKIIHSSIKSCFSFVIHLKWKTKVPHCQNSYHAVRTVTMLSEQLLRCQNSYHTVRTVTTLSEQLPYCQNSYHTVRTVPKSNRKCVETEAKCIPLKWLSWPGTGTSIKIWLRWSSLMGSNLPSCCNTVVSNHFHSVKILLFSSARSRDFAGMYTTKLQSICAVLTFDPRLKNILTFSVKDRYQLNYFICIKDFNAETITSLKLSLFSFFIYGFQHHERKTICLYVYISVIRQTVRYRTPVFIQRFSWHLHITITYNLLHLRLWYADVVTVIMYTPEVVCRALQTSRHEKDGTWLELTWFETTILCGHTSVFHMWIKWQPWHITGRAVLYNMLK